MISKLTSWWLRRRRDQKPTIIAPTREEIENIANTDRVRVQRAAPVNSVGCERKSTHSHGRSI
jgi:hypothetical protein